MKMRAVYWLFPIWLGSCAGLWAEGGAIQLSGQIFDAGTCIITNSGLYVFTEGVTFSHDANGIEVDADNVTIDLNGFLFRGALAPYDRNAIHQAAGRTGLCIKNGFIERWGGAAAGAEALRLEGRQIRVEDMIFRENRGLVISAGEQATIRNCILANNRNGGILAGTNSSIKECVLSSNSLVGIECSDSASVEHCIVSGHINGAGILVHTKALVCRNLCASNQIGVAIAEGLNASGNILLDNHAAGNATGYKATGTGTNLIIGNSAVMSSVTEFDLAAPNAFGEIWISSASNRPITNNSAALNFEIK